MTMFYSPSLNTFGSREELDDGVEVDAALYGSLMGHAIEPGPDGLPRLTAAAQGTQAVQSAVRLIQEQLDSAARSYGYDDIKTAITYRGDPNPKFAAEAEKFFLWRSACWTAAYVWLAEVQAGLKPLPTIEDLPGLLPKV